jgi:hypothetical protein
MEPYPAITHGGNLTVSQLEALKWLREHNGTGVFDKHGVLLAAGESGPFMRSTWNTLRDKGAITIDGRRATICS